MRVYLDNSATTKTDPLVIEAMKPYFTEKYGNASSLHQFGRDAKETLESSREIIAKKINAEPNEVIFTSGGSESNNLALKGVAYLNPGKHIITSTIEHPAILGTCKTLELDGFKVTYLDVDKGGLVKLDQLKKAITKDTVLVSIMHANNEIGTIQDIEKIGKICRENNVLFHTDAVQSLSKVPIDVKKNIDMASFSSHKLHGPKGIGAIFIKKGTKLKKQIEGGAHEYHRRAGTENITGAVGFAKAVSLATDDHVKKMTVLRDRLIDELLKIPHTQLSGSRENRLCNNANIAFNYIEGEGILLHLDMLGIAVSTGSACSSQSLKPSHVLMALGFPAEIAHGCIRFTLSRYTTEEEIDYTVKNVKEVIENLRKLSPLIK